MHAYDFIYTVYFKPVPTCEDPKVDKVKHEYFETFCFPFCFLQVRYNDLTFYERLTDPEGPAMTHAMFAIGWLEAGEEKKAETAFFKNYANIQGPFKVVPYTAYPWYFGAKRCFKLAASSLMAISLYLMPFCSYMDSKLICLCRCGQKGEMVREQ